MYFVGKFNFCDPRIFHKIVRPQKFGATQNVRNQGIRNDLLLNPRIAARVMQECPVKHDAMRNILVFVSAVIPKAFASLLTSFVIEMAKPSNVSIFRYRLLFMGSHCHRVSG